MNKELNDKICGLRVFEDAAGKMNVSPTDAGASLLIISQFTLFADCKSRRPGFTAAARPETAIPLYELVIQECRERGFAVLPSQANFVFARHPHHGGKELLDGLRERGVLARWWSTPEIADWLRISIGTDGDMAALMAALDGILLYSESS